MSEYLSLDELKRRYPDEWVLLGDPVLDNTTVLGGTLLFHSRDKREVSYLGRDKVANYTTATVAFAGDISQHRKIGILRKL